MDDKEINYEEVHEEVLEEVLEEELEEVHEEPVEHNDRRRVMQKGRWVWVG